MTALTHALAHLLGCTTREAAGFIVACPLWLFGAFLATMNWLILRFNSLEARKGSGKWSSMGASFGVPLLLGCLVFAPLRIHALWVWLLDPSAIVLVLAIPTFVRGR